LAVNYSFVIWRTISTSLRFFLHWSLCEIPQSTLRFFRTSKSQNTKISSKLDQISSERETFERFLSFVYFGYAFFICDFMKILKKSQIFSLRNLCEIPQSTLKIFQNIKFSKYRFRVRNDLNMPKLVSKGHFLVFFQFCCELFIFDFMKISINPCFRAWNGQNMLKWGWNYDFLVVWNLARKDSLLISWKILGSLAFICDRTSERSRRASTLKFLQNIKIQKHWFRVGKTTKRLSNEGLDGVF